ncbi:MAG: 1-phosphofructokinase [Armatimonadota bacterium]|nr:1-phosphofructokinase [bacterium]MDW8319947.1 1-phosphofructokinase [Armatimonadota bacterium]
MNRKPSVLTVTLNAAVDKTYRVEGFCLDRVFRVEAGRVVAGGKGINVARVLHTLGVPVVATGFLGGHNGAFILDSLKQEGIPGDFVWTQGESRVCLAVIDPVAGTQTELNEIGPEIRSEEVSALEQKMAQLLPQFAYVTLSGSAPPGVPADFYARVIRLGRNAGVKMVLDSSGALLKQGVEAIPWMLKPNRVELAAIFGQEPADVPEATEMACQLVAKGIEVIVVTLGKQGAVWVSADGAWFAQPPEVEFVSAVGSGDSMLAAMLYAMIEGMSPPDILRWGVAAGAANAAVFGAGFCTRGQIESLVPRVLCHALG